MVLNVIGSAVLMAGTILKLEAPALPFGRAAVQIGRLMFVSALAISFGVAAVAGELKPMQAQTIALGAIQGVVYYTVEPDGFRIVITVSSSESGTTQRIISTLAQDQKVIVSIPGEADAPETSIWFKRQGDHLHISEGQLGTN